VKAKVAIGGRLKPGRDDETPFRIAGNDGGEAGHVDAHKSASKRPQGEGRCGQRSILQKKWVQASLRQKEAPHAPSDALFPEDKKKMGMVQTNHPCRAAGANRRGKKHLEQQ